MHAMVCVTKDVGSLPPVLQASTCDVYAGHWMNCSSGNTIFLERTTDKLWWPRPGCSADISSKMSSASLPL